MPILRHCLTIVLFFLSAAPGHATGSPSQPTRNHDPYAACNKSAGGLSPSDLRDQETAVFAVLVTREGQLQRTGTATLIDDTGIFVTAAHTVHFSRNGVIKLQRTGNNGKETFEAEVLTDTSDFWKKDFVLVRARDWRKDARHPYPIRFDESASLESNYIGYAEGDDRPSRYELKYFRDEQGESVFLSSMQSFNPIR
jgi:hypothetical protein